MEKAHRGRNTLVRAWARRGRRGGPAGRPAGRAASPTPGPLAAARGENRRGRGFRRRSDPLGIFVTGFGPLAASRDRAEQPTRIGSWRGLTTVRGRDGGPCVTVAM